MSNTSTPPPDYLKAPADCEELSQFVFEQVKLILTDPTSYRASLTAWKEAANRIKTLPDDYATYSEMLAELEPTIVGRRRMGPFRLLDADLLKILQHYFTLAATARRFSKGCSRRDEWAFEKTGQSRNFSGEHAIMA